MSSLLRLACCLLGLAAGGCFAHRETKVSREQTSSNFLENALMSFLGVRRLDSPFNRGLPIGAGLTHNESDASPPALSFLANRTHIPTDFGVRASYGAESPLENAASSESERATSSSTDPRIDVGASQQRNSPAIEATVVTNISNVSNAATNPKDSDFADSTSSVVQQNPGNPSAVDPELPPAPADVAAEPNAPPAKEVAKPKDKVNDVQKRDQDEAAVRRAVWNEIATKIGAGPGFTGETAGLSGSTGVGAGSGHTGIGAGAGHTGIGAGKGSTGIGASPLPNYEDANSSQPLPKAVTVVMLITPWGPAFVPVVTGGQ